jgi:S1-C subfamily serine protease
VTAQFTFLSGARVGQVETFRKAYVGLGRHPLSDIRCDAERDLDVSSRHASIVRHGETFVVRDLGSTNGTFVNAVRISGDVVLADGDVIGLGQNGPAVAFHILPAEPAVGTVPDAAVAVPRPRRSSTALRMVAEVARLNRRTKLLIGLLVVVLAGFAALQWQSARDAREVARLQARADSLEADAQRLLTRLQTELASVRDALRQSQADVARLRTELAAAGTSGNAGAVARLRAALDKAETRQRGLAGAVAMDYRAISLNNQDAVALLVVQFSDSEIFSGTAFAADSQGTLITNRHVLVGEDGNRQPLRIAIKFSGSRQWFPGRLVGVADSADVAVVKVEILGGTPRVAGFAGEPQALARGDPVAIIGYPLGEDLPMEHIGESGVVADPTLTVGTVSKILATVVQVDGYGAPGSSGSPIFDRTGRVAAVLYGGNRESQGKIIYAVPASQIVAYLNHLNTVK